GLTERRLRVEMMLHQARGHACGLRDVADRRRRDAARRELGERRIANARGGGHVLRSPHHTGVLWTIRSYCTSETMSEITKRRLDAATGVTSVALLTLAL